MAAPPESAGFVLARILRPSLGTSADASTARLIQEFGTEPAVLSASMERLSRIVGREAAEAITAVHDACLALLSGHFANTDATGTPDAIAAFFQASIGHTRVEEVHAVFLDSFNRPLRCELVGRGSLSQAPLYPREIVRRGLEVGAAAVVVVHNHPSGSPRASNADLAATKALIAAGVAVDLPVLDHIIVAASGWTSLRAEGLL